MSTSAPVDPPQPSGLASALPHEARKEIPTKPVLDTSTPDDISKETKAAPVANKTPWTRWWIGLMSTSSRLANQKIDMTISRLIFIISIVSLVVAVLSYNYGAASYRIAKSAYQLQQLEFCKDHTDDPQVVASKHCQLLVAKPVDAIVMGRATALRPSRPGQAIADDRFSVTNGGMNHPAQSNEMIDTCRPANPFDLLPQCRPQLKSKGLSRIAQPPDQR
ncbi:MAG: hypothetical protein Q9182_004114 [Xanthomendoza sp. 2 TL-2023]